MKLKEIWRDVVGYEGKYQVSTFGRVKSLNYNHTGKERILKPRPDGHGYYKVALCKNGKQKNLRVHRLVAEAFLYKIPKGMVVNHINEIKTDNRLENLEIVTQKENVNHGTGIARMSQSLKGEKNPFFGKKHTDETRLKISEAKKGKKHTDESRQKMSEAQKAYWQRRRKCVNNGMTTLINLPPRLAAIIEQKIKEDYPEHEVIKKGS